MKKISVLLLAFSMWAAFCPLADARKNSMQRIGTVISEYKDKDGFEVVKVGSLLTSLMKGAILNGGVPDGDNEKAMMLMALNGIKKMTVVDYEDASAADRNSFNARVSKLLEECDVLMEVKEDDSLTRIYGHMDEAGKIIHDFILFSPGEGALLYMTGSLALDDLAGIMNR